MTIYPKSVKFDGLFQTLRELVGNSAYSADPAFSQLITEICNLGLEALEQATSEDLSSSPSTPSNLVGVVRLVGGDDLEDVHSAGVRGGEGAEVGSAVRVARAGE